MSRVLIVGSIAYDTLHLPSGHYPRTLGGSAVYAALATAKFVTPRIVGVVGEDFAKSDLQILREQGVDLAGLKVASGETFHWEGRYTADLRDRSTMKTELNVFASFNPTLPDDYADIPFVMLGNIDPALQLAVLDQLTATRWVVADTMNYWIERDRDVLAKMLARIDMLVINEEEARQLSGSYHLREVASRIHAMGPRSVVIKQGEYGAMLFDREGLFSAPSFPLATVVDPTGAGDSFAGGVLGYLARCGDTSHAELRRAVTYGAVVASFCVEQVGSRALIELEPGMLEERYAEYCALARF